MKIRVENLSVSSTKAELWRAFERCGSVVSVDIVTSRETGIRLGFALVEMACAGDAYDAIRALDGTELGGRNLKVQEAQSSRLTRPLHGH
jgi:RNA recognition motif-containing protein